MNKRLLVTSLAAFVAVAAVVFSTSVASVRAALAPTSRTETVLYKFQAGQDGAHPWAGVVADADGALYGTTQNGGDQNGGTVFKLAPSASGYAESIIYRFPSSGGVGPEGGVIIDGGGALYGTTLTGGPGNHGVAFKLSPTPSGYTETTIHQFTGAPMDGSNPHAGLASGPKGMLFGTTSSGGTADLGTVFELTPSGTGYSERVLYSFQGGQDGKFPNATVFVNAAGDLFGTTPSGGSSNCPDGCGIVFALYPNGHTYTERVLYRFTRTNGDGGNPIASLVGNASGELFGTTPDGGRCELDPTGCGTVYRLKPTGGHYVESVLHRFQAGDDGWIPEGGVIIGRYGALYGTTASGGVHGGCRELNCGTVFELVPSAQGYEHRTIFSFQGLAEGYFPECTLLADKSGALYGTTPGGGSRGSNGTVFRLSR